VGGVRVGGSRRRARTPDRDRRGRRGRAPDRDRRDAGFVLLDVLVTLLIVLIGFAVFLSSVSIAGKTAVARNQRVLSIVERRNADARDRVVVFQADK
jgi:type II secretory pathway pseudopilin PulG